MMVTGDIVGLPIPDAGPVFAAALPLWERLPHLTYWLLPSLVGIPLMWFALQRFRGHPDHG
jgi:hypothetical protein